MFTGIIKYLGQIKSIKKLDSVYLEIHCPSIIPHLEIGSSVAVDGACLTITKLYETSFQVQLMPETWNKTAFNQKTLGDIVNMELGLRLQDAVDGHLVMGHVDGLGQVQEFTQFKDNWVLRIQPPRELMRYISQKGSICINGTSLTVSNRQPESFEVSLIEYTLEHTNLSLLKFGDVVNLEVDIIARYLENLIPRP